MEVRLGQSQNMDDNHPNDEERENRSTSNDGGGGIDLGGGVGRFYGWPASRIVRVSRASGGKDRHSKVLTSKGLRDRRVRLSVNTAIQFYDLQDRLGYDQPSKAVEWLLAAAASSIAELPPMNTHFLDTSKGLSGVRLSNIAAAEVDIGNGNSGKFQQEAVTKSPAGSSNSETSKGSGISIVRSEGRFEAREGANDGVAEKEKEIDNESSYLSSFSELLSGKINFINESVNQDYFTSGLSGPPATRQEQIVPLPLLSAAAAAAATDYHHTERQHFSFASDNLFSVNSPGFAAIDRGTLQSNSPLPLSNFPPLPNFFTGAAVPTGNHHHFLPGFDARLQLYYSDAHGNDGRHSGQREKDKN